jgi:endonuclease/exonuclease/phosphatase family metal-dependent hydrolase
MRKLIKITLLFLTLISALTLLLAYLSVHVNPEVFWFLGLIGLAYPFLLLANFIFLVYWIIRWKRYFIIPLIAILLGVSHFSNFFQFPFGKGNQANDNQIKVLTYNVNLFQLYAWTKEPPNHNEIFKFIRDQQPDIVCLQEFYIVNDRFSELEAKSMLDSNVHIGYILKKESSAYGMATYSRFPIIKTGQIKFDDSANACIFTDLLINTDTIRVYNTHLQSLRLKERNLNFLLSQNYRKESQRMDEIKDISFRYRNALKKRAQQVEKVTNHILNSPHPVIVCGDFNESPISYNYYKMRNYLNDAFVEAGIGVGHTYRNLLPSFRIDYVLYDKSYRANSYSSPRVEYSDHYPVIATLVKKE